MKIVEIHSHLNGLEYLEVHKRRLWRDVCAVMRGVDVRRCKTNPSAPSPSAGQPFYSPIEINREIWIGFENHDWGATKKRGSTEPETVRFPPPPPIEFVKERVGVEIQIGKSPFAALELFARHMALFVGDLIDVGVEILPMKTLQQEMSSGVAYYEGELYNLIREGRGVPAVPRVLVGVEP